MDYDQRRVTPVREVMTTMVVVATPDDHLIDAARTMREARVSGLPVVTTDRTVVGVVSERDLVAELHRSAGLLSFRGLLDLILAFSGDADTERVRQSVQRLQSGRVGEIMTKPPVVADPEDSVQECMRLMKQYHVNRLPIVENGRLVGMIARGDVIRWLTIAPTPVPSKKVDVPLHVGSTRVSRRPKPPPTRKPRPRARMDDVR